MLMKKSRKLEPDKKITKIATNFPGVRQKLETRFSELFRFRYFGGFALSRQRAPNTLRFSPPSPSSRCLLGLRTTDRFRWKQESWNFGRRVDSDEVGQKIWTTLKQVFKLEQISNFVEYLAFQTKTREEIVSPLGNFWSLLVLFLNKLGWSAKANLGN